MNLIESYLPRVVNDSLWVEATPKFILQLNGFYILNLPLIG